MPISNTNTTQSISIHMRKDTRGEDEVKRVQSQTLIHLNARASLPSLHSPISKLYLDLCNLFRAVKATGVDVNRFQSPESFRILDGGVRNLIGAYLKTGHKDWMKYTGFNPIHYVRHLIDANDDFELMIVCWSPGQESRCHNHADSHCWLSVLDGTVDEIRYKSDSFAPEGEENESIEPQPASFPSNVGPNVLGASRPCPKLQYVSGAKAEIGDCLYINDSQGLHVVRCNPSTCPPPGACTLHLYSPPITRVSLYDPASNKVVSRIPGFYSIRGARV